MLVVVKKAIYMCWFYLHTVIECIYNYVRIIEFILLCLSVSLFLSLCVFDFRKGAVEKCIKKTAATSEFPRRLFIQPSRNYIVVEVNGGEIG